MRKLLTATTFALALAAVPALAAQSPEAVPAQQPEAAGVRIVRLSQVVGDVQMDRDTGHGYEAAFPNLPIVQGSRLRTGNGVAEIELEDNSSLRLTPNTIVEFPVLASDGSGIRTSTVHVVQGQVYASMNKSVDDHVRLTFGRETLALGPSAHLRLAVGGAQPRVDVMNGVAQASNGTTTTEIGRKKALLFDAAETHPPTLTGKLDRGEFSEWDKQEAEYHSRLMPSGGRYAGTPYAYGLADMNYYGGFTRMGGCGTLWRPYMTSASWSPYSNGVWAWYRNAGYSWVSPYPWGWTAFHSGTWINCPGAGWGWQPANQWMALRNGQIVKKIGRINPPTHNPRPVAPTLVEVNSKPLVVSRLTEDNFVFRRDSAGLGVPRQTFGHLNSISSGVVRQGSVTRTIYFAGSNGPARGPQAGPAVSSPRGGSFMHSTSIAARGPVAGAPVSSGLSSGGIHGGPALSAGSFASVSGGGHAASVGGHR